MEVGGGGGMTSASEGEEEASSVASSGSSSVGGSGASESEGEDELAKLPVRGFRGCMYVYTGVCVVQRSVLLTPQPPHNTPTNHIGEARAGQVGLDALLHGHARGGQAGAAP